MLGTTEDPGIMVRTLERLFAVMETRKASSSNSDTHYNVTIAYCEIYNESIRDLLVPQNPRSVASLELREDPISGGAVVSGITELPVTSSKEIMSLLTQGNARRTTEATHVNTHSSRSHAILQVTVDAHVQQAADSVGIRRAAVRTSK